MRPARILIVDDDREIGRLVSELMQRHDYDVEVAFDAPGARALLARKAIDLILLDVMMPGESGLDLCRQLRTQTNVPILMLTAASQLTDKVVGLELGADDYMLKPFEGRELIARVRTLLRRALGRQLATGSRAKAPLAFGRWRMDANVGELRRDGELLVPLTKAEFAVLHALAERPNIVMSRDWLAESAALGSLSTASRNVDVVISRLRAKMAPHEGGRPTLQTVRGGGYLLRTT